LLFHHLAVLFGPFLWDVDPKRLYPQPRNWRPIYQLLFDRRSKGRLGDTTLEQDQLAVDIMRR